MKNFFFVFAFIMASAVFAQNVSINEAQKIAQKFIETKTTNVNLKSISLSERGFNNFYIFSDDQNHAFVAVSGSKLATPIIAYSTESSASAEMIPPVKEYFEWIESQIIEAKTSRIINEQAADEWEALESRGNLPVYNRTAVAPLLKTLWNQDCGYNAMAPAATAGPCGHCYAGCVATAMGQIMKYHSYPSQGQGAHTYTSTYGDLTANFGETTYHWDQMVNSGVSETNPNNEIAQLLFHCGVAVEMGYNIDGSGAFSQRVPSSLTEYFKYPSYVAHQQKGGNTDLAWAETIGNELISKRPVYYSGSAQNGSGGHAFVCDGIDNQNKLHMNFGWSGAYNGYYAISSIKPTGNDFTYNQAIVYGIEKDTNITFCDGTKTLTETAGVITDGSGDEKYANNTNCSWIIKPNGATSISFTVKELGIDFDDAADYLKIYKGNSAIFSNLVKTLSGYDLPNDPIVVSDGEAFVQFVTNDKLRSLGFKIEYSAATGIKEAWNNDKIKVYPVPASESVTIDIESNIVTTIKKIEIISTLGQIINVVENPTTKQIINLNNISSGVYGVRFVGDNDSYCTMIEVK